MIFSNAHCENADQNWVIDSACLFNFIVNVKMFIQSSASNSLVYRRKPKMHSQGYDNATFVNDNGKR